MKEKIDFADFGHKNGKDAFGPLLDEGLDIVENKINKIKDLPEKQRDKLIKKEIFPLLMEVDNFELERCLKVMKDAFHFNARIIEALRSTIKSRREEAKKQKEIKKFEAPEKYKMSEEEKKEALEYLKSPDLISKIKEDITKIGVIGEDINKLALYLISLTRKFKKPIHAVLFARTSSGKSYLVNAIAELVPPEDRVVLTSATARSLDYLEGDSAIKEKFLVVQEIHGMKEVEDNIRLIQSEGKLTRIRTVSEPATGKMKTKSNEVEFQASVVTTTTLHTVHPENLTRIFEIYLDESQEQTKKISEFIKEKNSLEWQLQAIEREKIEKLHHNIQRMLSPLEVTIPFVKYIEFPSSSTRHRRDIDRFLNLIKAVAFLRQYQKEMKEKGNIKYIEAELEDYRIAYDIANELLKLSLSNIPEKARSVYEVCKDASQPYYGFTRRDIREGASKLGIELPSDPTLIKILNYLTDEGFLYVEQGQKGRSPYVYKLADPLDSDSKSGFSTPGILTPEQLKKKMKSGGNKK